MYEPERKVLEIQRDNILGLNREENGVGILAGAFLAGGKPLRTVSLKRRIQFC